MSLASLAVVLVGLIIGGGVLQLRIDTSVDTLLPADDAAMQALEDKARTFGDEPIVVLLQSDNPRELLLKQENLGRLLQLEGNLAQLPDVADVYGPATVLNQIAGASQDLLAQISGRRDALRSEAEAQARQSGADERAVERAGRDAVAKFDRRYGSLLVRGLPAGLPTLRNPEFVRTVLFDEHGAPRSQWRFVHPNAKSVAVLVRPRADLDQAAAGRLADAVRHTVAESNLSQHKVTVTGVPVVTSALTEQAQRELPVLGAVALVAVGLIFLVAPWSGRRRSRLRPVAAALVGTGLTASMFGWLGHPLSVGVVAFLPILIGIGSDFPFYLSQPGSRRRTVVVALAAAAGFGSLAVSPLPFVRELGLTVAAGILVILAVALLMRRTMGVASPPEPATVTSVEQRPNSPRRKRFTLLGAAVGVAAIGLAVLPQLDIESRPDEMARGLPELADARYAEDVMRSSAEISIVLRGDNVASPKALEWARKAEEAVVRQHGDQMRPVMTLSSLLAFLGPDPSPEQVSAGLELLPSYLTSAVLHPDRSEAVMTFGTQVHDLERQRAMLDDLRTELPPVPDGFEMELVGLPVAAVQGVDLASGGQVLINVAGIAAAGVVLAAGLRQRRDALRAVLTVALAFGWLLALAWPTIGSLNPLTVAVGSLTVATGCEFAIMLAGARRTRSLWSRRSVAIAALAGSLGYLVLALSGVALLREFGLLLSASVILSYLAARLVLWALPPARKPSPGVGGEPATTAVNRMEAAV